MGALNSLMDSFIQDYRNKIDVIIEHLKEDLKSIRTGRANPALVENIIVEAYGGQSKLKLFELATITTEGPTSLIVVPFDPSTLQDIEKAILKSPLNITPQTQTTRIILRLPPLSSDQREKITKFLNQKIEDKKVNLRNYRDEVRKKIKLAIENKEISEDEKYRLEKEIDSLTQKIMKEIELIKEIKKKEITEI